MIRQIIQTTCYKAAIFILRLLLIYMLAHLFTPEEFGAYSIIVTTYTFLTLICGLSLANYLSRVIPGQLITQQIAVFKTTFIFEVGLTTIFVSLFILSGMMKPTTELIKISTYKDAFFIGLLLLITTMASIEITNYLWSKIKITYSNRMDFITQALWVLPLLLAWYIGKKFTVKEILLINLGGVILGIVYGFCQIEFRAFLTAKFNTKILREGLIYSAPLMVPAISVTALRSGDRFILAYYHNLHDVGVYSFAFNFLNTLYTFSAVVIFSNMMPYIVKAHNLNNIVRRNILMSNAVLAAIFTFIGGSAILIIFSNSIIELIARPEYLDSRKVLPLLAIGTLNLILSYPGHTILSLQNRTLLLMKIDFFGFLIGMCCSFILIPKYSYQGAAWGMAITFGLTTFLKSFYAKLWEEINLAAAFLHQFDIFINKISLKQKRTYLVDNFNNTNEKEPSPKELAVNETDN